MIEKLHTKEVDIELEYHQTNLTSLEKDNIILNIKARGDLTHHVIEGVVELLTRVSPTNPHLNRRPKCVECERVLFDA